MLALVGSMGQRLEAYDDEAHRYLTYMKVLKVRMGEPCPIAGGGS